MDLHAAHYLNNLYSMYYPWLTHAPSALRLTGMPPLHALRHAPVEPKRRHTRHFIDDILADETEKTATKQSARRQSLYDEKSLNKNRSSFSADNISGRSFDECSASRSPPSSPLSSSRLTTQHLDADVMTPHREKKKKARTTFTGRQIFELEKKFEAKKYLTATERSDLAARLHVTETQVRAKILLS